MLAEYLAQQVVREYPAYLVLAEQQVLAEFLEQVVAQELAVFRELQASLLVQLLPSWNSPLLLRQLLRLTLLVLLATSGLVLISES